MHRGDFVRLAAGWSVVGAAGARAYHLAFVSRRPGTTPLRGRRERPELKFRFSVPDDRRHASLTPRGRCRRTDDDASYYCLSRAAALYGAVFGLTARRSWQHCGRLERVCNRRCNFGGSVEPNRPPHDNRNKYCWCVRAYLYVGYFFFFFLPT